MKMNVKLIKAVVNDVRMYIVILNQLIASEDTSPSSLQRAAILQLMVRVGENIKYLQPSQPSDLLDQLSSSTSAEMRMENYYRNLFGGGFSIYSGIFKQLRDIIVHTYLFEKHAKFPSPIFVSIFHLIKCNLLSLSFHVDQIHNSIGEKTFRCAYEARQYEGNDLLFYKPADYLMFIKIEIRELIAVLKRSGFGKDSTSSQIGVKLTEPVFVNAIEHHISNMGQLLKEYSFYFLETNPNYDKDVKGKDTYFDSTMLKCFGEFIDVRSSIAHLSSEQNNFPSILSCLMCLEDICRYVDSMLSTLSLLEADGKQMFSCRREGMLVWESQVNNPNEPDYWKTIWDQAELVERATVEVSTALPSSPLKRDRSPSPDDLAASNADTSSAQGGSSVPPSTTTTSTTTQDPPPTEDHSPSRR